MPKKNPSIEGLKKKAATMKQSRMQDILGEMQVKLNEIEELRKEMHREQSSITPQKSRSMLEEIKVPPIEVIREEKKKD